MCIRDRHSAKVLASVAHTEVPRIHFGVSTGELLDLMAQAGADVMGVDFRITLAQAAQRISRSMPLQGNLDPAALFAPWPVVEAAVADVLAAAEGLPGHIFNLGHGVPPETDPDVLTRVVELVHQSTAR